MAANPYRKVTPGETLTSFPAQLFNTLIDVANRERSGQLEGRSAAPLLGSLPERGIVVPIKNNTGDALPRFSVLGITGPIINPDDNLAQFKNRPTFVGDVPTGDFDQHFVITQEPMGSGVIGLAMLTGVTAVQIDVIHADDAFADLSDDETELRSQPWGCCPILWKDSGTGTQWGYVQLGSFVRQSFEAEAAEAITKGTSGNVTVRGETLEVYAAFGDIEDGAPVWVSWDSLNLRWTAIQTECPA